MSKTTATVHDEGMNNVPEIVMSRRVAIVAGVVIACALQQACAQKGSPQSPQDSGEAGGPPVIDGALVSLGTRGPDVLLMGKKGAVTPAGVTIHVTNLESDASANARVNKDGSFEVKAPGTSAQSYRVRAGSGKDADQVFVLPDMTVRGENDDGSLSCRQQDQLAGHQVGVASDIAMDLCTRDDDCVIAPTTTVCHDGCNGVPVSKDGAMLIDWVVASINDGLCGDFTTDGCKFIALPCEPPPGSGEAACVDGHCRFAEASDGGATGDAGL